MPKTRGTEQCFFYLICNNEIKIGPPVKEGEYISRYQITVCRSCYESNWDGWELGREKILLKHLEDNDIPIPNRDTEGWLPRD